MEGKEPYQFTSEEGDIVRLPSGDFGVITKQEIICAGHCKRVLVFPFVGAVKKFFGALFLSYEFLDNQINRLQRVGSLTS